MENTIMVKNINGMLTTENNNIGGNQHNTMFINKDVVNGLNQRHKLSNKQLAAQCNEEMKQCIDAQVAEGLLTKKRAKELKKNPMRCMTGDTWACDTCDERRVYKDPKAARLAWRLHKKKCK